MSKHVLGQHGLVYNQSLRLQRLRKAVMLQGMAAICCFAVLQEPVHPHSSKEGDKAGAALQWRAGAMYATALLQELVRHSHHDALRAWAIAAPAVQSAVSDALSAAPEHSNEGMAPFANFCLC